MSALPQTAVPLPARTPARPLRPEPARPRLEVVRAPERTRTRVPFVVLCMVVLAAAMLGTLVLNTSMAQGEYERFELESALARSAQEQQELAEDLEHVSSSPELARSARRLGMVPAGDGGYLRLSDGTVLGDPKPARAKGDA